MEVAYLKERISRMTLTSLSVSSSKAWCKLVGGGNGRATGGTPNDWDAKLVFVGQNEAARHTGQSQGIVCECLDDI